MMRQNDGETDEIVQKPTSIPPRIWLKNFKDIKDYRLARMIGPFEMDRSYMAGVNYLFKIQPDTF